MMNNWKNSNMKKTGFGLMRMPVLDKKMPPMQILGRLKRWWICLWKKDLPFYTEKFPAY